jgi:hypothetical protein
MVVSCEASGDVEKWRGELRRAYLVAGITIIRK